MVFLLSSGLHVKFIMCETLRNSSDSQLSINICVQFRSVSLPFRKGSKLGSSIKLWARESSSTRQMRIGLDWVFDYFICCIVIHLSGLGRSYLAEVTVKFPLYLKHVGFHQRLLIFSLMVPMHFLKSQKCRFINDRQHSDSFSVINT